MENCDLEALEVQANFGEILGAVCVCGGGSFSKQDSGKNRMNRIASSVSNLKDMFATYLTKAADMLYGSEIAGSGKC